MADVKWIKIATEIFDNRKIKQIEKMPEGDAIIVVWFKLLCLAGNINDGGMIYFTKEMPYTEEMLSVEFNRPIQTIRLAITTFERFGMIEVVDDVFYISSWEKYQNVEGLERIREQTRRRVAKHREKARQLMENSICQYCGSIATGYDHIVAIARGGNDEEDNKVECCIECNRSKNDKPLVDFLNNNRDRINDNLVLNNYKLSRFVTLCNVTGNYIVTQGNATDKNKIREDKEKKEIKNKYGAYAHVRLKKSELDKLNEEFGTELTQEAITFLDEYIEMKGYKARSHYLCIRKWVIDAVKERKNKSERGNMNVGCTRTNDGNVKVEHENELLKLAREAGVDSKFEGF